MLRRACFDSNTCNSFMNDMSRGMGWDERRSPGVYRVGTLPISWCTARSARTAAADSSRRPVESTPMQVYRRCNSRSLVMGGDAREISTACVSSCASTATRSRSICRVQTRIRR